jgi:hypothetical protein
MGQYPAEMLQAAHIRVLRDRKEGKPGAANNRLKYLSAMFSWAVESDHLPHNPVRDVKKVKYATDGFRIWTQDECALFQVFYPVGTKARLVRHGRSRRNRCSDECGAVVARIENGRHLYQARRQGPPCGRWRKCPKSVPTKCPEERNPRFIGAS